MTSTMPQPPADPPPGDEDADARFAAYLAELAAHVDDPDDGEELRAFLNDDPQEQRAIFDFVEAITAPPPPPTRRTLAWIAVTTLVIVAAYVVLVIRFVP